jgi:predicted RNase H-like nuclease (RuvC/YqgF family)
MSDTPQIDAGELYYDGPTGFVPIEDARKVERKLNDALKENARLRPALMGFSQAEELMELREDLRKQLRCSLDLARQNNILQDYNKILGQELQDTKQELEEARREIAKLKASSNENYWELSRQRGNMLHALHEISAAVKRGMRQGGITIGETEVLGRMEGRE